MNHQKLAEPSVESLSFGTTPNFVTKLSLQFITGDKILDLGVGEGRDILFLAKEIIIALKEIISIAEN